MTTRSTEELGDFDAAAEAAVAELLNETGSGDSDPDMSSGEEEVTEADGQASDEADEQAEEPTESATQPEEAEEEEDEFFADLIDEEGEEDEGQPPPDIDSMTFELPGVEEPITLQELKDGYLRQSDYTRKTQEVAAQREETEQAMRFWEALQSRPEEAVRRLAIDVGLISEGDKPAADRELSPFRTAEEVEQEIQKRVEEALDSHPTVQEARIRDVKQRMEDAFSKIEKDYSVKLGPKSRREILVRAQKSGTPDLELVFNAMRAQKEQRAASTEDLKAAAPSRPTGHTSKESVDPQGVESLDEAWELAEVSLGKRG